jgi:hypothetical protein
MSKKSNGLYTPCPRCAGSGRVELAQVLREALDAVTTIKDATAPKVRQKLDPKHKLHVTAFNNRLEDLWRLGLVERKKNGREWIYNVK